MKLTKILEEIISEIGETSKEPYLFQKKKNGDFDAHDPSAYVFKSDEGAKYAAKIFKQEWQQDEDDEPYLEYEVMFGVMGGGEIDYKVTSKNKNAKLGNPFRVMATMLAIVNAEIEFDREKSKKRVKRILMEPTKSEDEEGNKNYDDMRRANFYKAVIEKNMPQGSKVEMDKDGQQIEIELPN